MPILPMYITVSLLELIKCMVGYYLVKRRKWVNNIVSFEEA